MDCPLYFDDCDDICMHYSKDVCGWFFPPRPMSEILTVDERLDRLEGTNIPKIEVKHITVHEPRNTETLPF